MLKDGMSYFYLSIDSRCRCASLKRLKCLLGVVW